MAPPTDWVILRKAGYFYPAYILTESPRTYALVMTKHLWRSKFSFEANELVVNDIRSEQRSYSVQMKPLSKPIVVCRFCTFSTQDLASCWG